MSMEMKTVIRQCNVEAKADPPHDTNVIWAWQCETFGVENPRLGAIKQMNWLRLDWVRPERLPKYVDPEAQVAFIASYESLMNGWQPDEKVVFIDTMHPEHEYQPAHGWFIKGDCPVVRKTKGRHRMNIHGALNLEAMQLIREGCKRIIAEISLVLFKRIESAWPDARTVHLFLDNTRHHHTGMLKPWQEYPKCCLKLYFQPHLNPVARLWGVMHWRVKHNRFHRDFRQFTKVVDAFFDATFQQMREKFSKTAPTFSASSPMTNTA